MATNGLVDVLEVGGVKVVLVLCRQWLLKRLLKQPEVAERGIATVAAAAATAEH